jgi:hypothetical protein
MWRFQARCGGRRSMLFFAAAAAEQQNMAFYDNDE